MARKLEQLLADLPEQRRVAVEARAGNLATLKDLREAVEQTQQDLAATLGVWQDTTWRRRTVTAMYKGPMQPHDFN